MSFCAHAPSACGRAPCVIWLTFEIWNFALIFSADIDVIKQNKVLKWNDWKLKSFKLMVQCYLKPSNIHSMYFSYDRSKSWKILDIMKEALQQRGKDLSAWYRLQNWFQNTLHIPGWHPARCQCHSFPCPFWILCYIHLTYLLKMISFCDSVQPLVASWHELYKKHNS